METIGLSQSDISLAFCLECTRIAIAIAHDERSLSTIIYAENQQRSSICVAYGHTRFPRYADPYTASFVFIAKPEVRLRIG